MRVVLATVLFCTSAMAHAGKSPDECAQEVGERATIEATRAAIADCLLDAVNGPPPKPMDAPAADNRAALKLARQYAGTYKQEISSSGPAIGSVLTIRSKLRRIGSRSHYDPAGEKVSFDSYGDVFSEFQFHEVCRATGTFVGQNSYGAKARVATQTGEEGVLEAIHSGELGLQRDLPAAPALYRQLLKTGFDLEVVFSLQSNGSGVVAELTRGTDKATIQNPVQTDTTRWTVYGHIREVRAVLPGDKRFVLLSK